MNEWTTSAQRQTKTKFGTQRKTRLQPFHTRRPNRFYSGDIRVQFDGPLNGNRPSPVPRGPSVMDGSEEESTFVRVAVRFGGGFDMISARGQFDNGGGPPPSTGSCC